MSSFNVGGIVSGIDTEGLITKLVAAASTPKTLMQNKQDGYVTQKDSYETLIERLDTLQSTLEDLDTESEFRSLKGSSTSDAVSVEVDGDGVIGTYSVQVNSIASSEMEVSNGFSSKTALGTIGTGNLVINYGGQSTTLTVGNLDSSLNGLASLINDNVDGVTAYVMDTGDASTPYRLVISGNDTGADYTIDIDATGLTGGSAVQPSFTEAMTAQDSEVVINGITITDSNTVIDSVVQGVTFNLNDVTDSAATVKVGLDTDALVSKMDAFVTAYNGVISYVGTSNTFNTDTLERGPFFAETTVSRLLADMKSKFSAQYSSSSIVTALSQIGFSTLQSGLIEFDASAFKDALANNIEDVTAIFTDSAGFNNAFQGMIETYTDSHSGYLSDRIDTLGDQIDSLDEDISNFDDRMTAYEERLRKSFTAMEIALGKLQTAQDALEALLPSTSKNSSS